jgi:very-short-patch-repair endonuclease
MNWRMFRSYKTSLSAKAHHLRRESTTGEEKLWSALRELRYSHALKFRRQQPIGPFIADFYCAALKCVVEVDGLSHDNEDGQERDRKRDAFMRENGLRVLRFTERDVVKNVTSIVQTILQVEGTPPPTPPSRGGE